MESTPPARPTASATIEPKGSRARSPREHVVKVTLKLSPAEPRFLDKSYLDGAARNALAPFRPANGDADSRTFGEILGKTGNKVIGIEGSVICPARPDARSVDELRQALIASGYNVVVRFKRECTEGECMADALTDWSRPNEVPTGWFSNTICGKHGYKTCGSCGSVYVMSSANAAGQAPSVHCDVCGTIMVEWGGTKVWTAQLVSRGDGVKS